jgi:hypothetical protein
LLECWSKHGIDNPQCKVYEDALDNAQNAIQNYQKKLKALKLKDSVMESLPKPTYKYHLKGRNEKMYYRPNPKNDLFPNEI